MSLTAASNPYGIELADGEQIEYITKRHWMLLLYHVAIPFIIMLLAGGLAAYRWFGGQFFVWDIAPRGLVDSFNVVLLIAIVLCGVGSAVQFRRKNQGLMWLLVAVAALCLGIFAFRYQGGRLFGMNTFEAAGVDLFNRILIGVILVMLLICTYIWVDWRNDTVVLTNRRVIHDRRDLFQRHVQDQITIEKIESAKAAKKTYLTHWLDYGLLIIQAKTMGRRMLLEMADEPGIMAGKISDKLKKYNSAQSEERFTQMVEKNVYGDKIAAARPLLQLRIHHSPKFLNWLFFDNPEIDDEKGEVIWYAHWIFVFASVLLPFSIFLIGVILLLLALRVSILVGIWAGVIGFILMVICFGWGFWRYKDTIDDLLQLTPDNLIKVDKLPFGPEKRRTAGLDAIRNVSFRSSFIGRVIGYGTIEVQTAGSDANMVIHQVPDPREIVSTIYEYMVEHKAREQERKLNDTLSLLHHFHQIQAEHGEFLDN